MSFWGKLGKIALKVAPIAAGFIPGVGPLASMAIGGLASGASKKLEGGSWKDALVSGGIGAGTGYLSGKLGGALKGPKKLGTGVSPSANALKNMGPVGLPNISGNMTGGVLKAGANPFSTGGELARAAVGGLAAKAGTEAAKKGGMSLGKKILGTAIPAASLVGAMKSSGPSPGDPSLGNDYFNRFNNQGGRGNRMRGLGGGVMSQRDQSFPNLAESIGQGRREAMQNQPFRGGYDITQPTYNEEGMSGPPKFIARMPTIGGPGRGGRGGSMYSMGSGGW